MTAPMLRHDIRAAVARGRSLEHIEREIVAAAPVARDSRDALWLYAWSLTWHRDRRVPVAR